MVEGSEGPLPLLDCQNSLKKRRPPRGRVARVMDRAHTPTHTHLPVWPLRRGLKSRSLASAQWRKQILTAYGMSSNVESNSSRYLPATLLQIPEN